MWKNGELKEPKAINDIVTRVLIENRQVAQPIEMGDFNYYYENVPECEMLVVCSLAKLINMPGTPAILRGLTIKLIEEYETAIRAITVDLNLDVFKSFDELYKSTLAALVKGNLTAPKPAEPTP